MSQLVVFGLPILKGKKEQWKEFTSKLRNEFSSQFVESRKKAGVRERSFVQSTPEGDLVIVTLEGNDPAAAFPTMFTTHDQYTDWFVQQVKEVHGIDLREPMPGPPPELIIDTNVINKH
jgi:hypothetical protein